LIASAEPPQQASVLSQKSPVIRQPLAGWQTVTPEPTSLHRRVQQFDAPAQGAPSWLQPPLGRRQRPGVGGLVCVAGALHRPEQQSWGR
jgi:hypothetical protein